MTDDLSAEALNNAPAEGAPSGSGEKQSERNWEETAKGLQRKNQQLQGDYTRLQEAVQAKNLSLQNSAKEVEDLKLRGVETAAQYEGQIAEWKVKHLTGEQTLSQKDRELQAAQARLQQYEIRDAIRKELSSEANQDLLGWFEAGYLKPVDEVGQPLSGDALTTFLNGFRARLTGNVQQKVEDTLAGTRPVTTRTGAVAPGKMSMEQLQDWLMKNPGHSDYDRMDEAYTDLVSQQFSRQEPTTGIA